MGTNRSITLPRPTDQHWIVTDRAVKHKGLGATLYVSRDKTLFLDGFNDKLHKNQINWLPYEVEALSIVAAIKYFSPFLIQSTKNACLLTDSKPCVQAFVKLCRGEFSTSPVVATFLLTATYINYLSDMLQVHPSYHLTLQVEMLPIVMSPYAKYVHSSISQRVMLCDIFQQKISWIGLQSCLSHKILMDSYPVRVLRP